MNVGLLPTFPCGKQRLGSLSNLLQVTEMPSGGAVFKKDDIGRRNGHGNQRPAWGPGDPSVG